MLFFDDFSFNFLAGAGAKTVKKSAEKSSKASGVAKAAKFLILIFV